jgi:hypothetical protein
MDPARDGVSLAFRVTLINLLEQLLTVYCSDTILQRGVWKRSARVILTPSRHVSILRTSIGERYWHVYVLPTGYFVWPCSLHIHRTEFVTSHKEQKTKAIRRGALQVWPISTLMPLEIKRRQNTINNTDWNVSCYCNNKLPKTYTWSGTFILKDGRYIFLFYE